MKNLNLAKHLTDPSKKKRDFAKKYINDPHAYIIDNKEELTFCYPVEGGGYYIKKYIRGTNPCNEIQITTLPSNSSIVIDPPTIDTSDSSTTYLKIKGLK